MLASFGNFWGSFLMDTGQIFEVMRWWWSFLESMRVRHFPDYPETFHTKWKLSRFSGDFPGYPETFRTIRKIFQIFTLSENFPDYLETFQIIRKLPSLSGNFPDHPETSQCNFKGYAQKLSGRAKTFWMAMPRCHDGFCASDAIRSDNKDSEQINDKFRYCV